MMTTPAETSHPTPRPGHLWRLLAGVTLPLYALDQGTKWLVRHFLDDPARPDTMVVIPNFFHLVSVTNTGAAFGMGHGNNGFFLALSLAALAALGVFYRLGFFGGSAWSRAGFALLASGIVGNLTDRLQFGHVIDFLHFDLHVPGAHPFPSFNVADSCICIAAGCFIIGSLREGRRAEPPAGSGAATGQRPPA